MTSKRDADNLPAQQTINQEGEIVASVPRTDVVELIRDMVMEQVDQGADPELAVMDRILTQIMTADDVDDVLSLNEPLSAKDVLGEELTLHGIDFTDSEVENPDGSKPRIPYYATLHVTRVATRKQCVVNCGGEKLLAQALWLNARATFPLVVKIIQVGKEKTGRTRPYQLTWAITPSGDGPSY